MNMIVPTARCATSFMRSWTLYISPAIVEDMELIKEKSIRDRVKNSHYEGTNFAKDLEEFCIESVHEGPTSLFEIPLAHYNLPRPTACALSTRSPAWWMPWSRPSGRTGGGENADDARFILCNLLKSTSCC